MIQPLLIPTAAEKRIDTDFYVEGYATTFDKPYLLYEWDGNKYYERIDRNALAGALGLRWCGGGHGAAPR